MCQAHYRKFVPLLPNSLEPLFNPILGRPRIFHPLIIYCITAYHSIENKVNSVEGIPEINQLERNCFYILQTTGYKNQLLNNRRPSISTSSTFLSSSSSSTLTFCPSRLENNSLHGQERSASRLSKKGGEYNLLNLLFMPPVILHRRHEILNFLLHLVPQFPSLARFCIDHLLFLSVPHGRSPSYCA